MGAKCKDSIQEWPTGGKHVVGFTYPGGQCPSLCRFFIYRKLIKNISLGLNPMPNEIEEILRQIKTATPANEAEVETKILLHIFRLLGFTDIDRADKPSVQMNFGREVKLKQPDSILYDGPERTLSKALITVEAKAIGIPIDDGRAQAKSYALWAGTPFYIVCNGEILLAVQFMPGAEEFRTLEIPINNISNYWEDCYRFMSRAEVILAKERLAYLSCYLPDVEKLPAGEFFKEYLNRLSARFSLIGETIKALVPPSRGQQLIPKIPVNTIIREETGEREFDEKSVANYLLNNTKRLLINGTPGSGKSTLCKRIINHLAGLAIEPAASIVPIYIPLSTFIPENVSDSLNYACTEMGVRVFPNLYQESLKHAQVIMILDGLDEIGFEDDSRDKLEKLINDSTYSIMITSRPIDEYILTDKEFSFGIIRDLTDEELRNVFREYFDGQSDIERILDNATFSLKFSLHSPLFALMAIRVAQSYGDWLSLSTFRLFERYITVLHNYFNADTVRGSGQSVSIDEVLSALSRVAIYLQKTSEISGVSLEALAHDMSEGGYETGFTALINIGLISVAGGKAILYHKSFQEFAIARYIISCIQNDVINGFIDAKPSEFVYQLVNSEVNEDEEARLIQWLSSSEKKVRKRVLNILQYKCSPIGIEKVINLIKEEKSIRVWAAAVRLLTNHQEEQFLEVIFAQSRNLSSRKRAILASALRKYEIESYLTWALKLIEGKKLRAVTACAFELAFRLGKIDVKNILIDLYFKENPGQRRNLCKLIHRFIRTSLAQDIVRELLLKEKAPVPIIYLLYIVRDNLSNIEDSRLINTCNVLNGDMTLRAKDRRRLRAIVEYLEASTINENGTKEQLLCLCKQLGAYQQAYGGDSPPI